MQVISVSLGYILTEILHGNPISKIKNVCKKVAKACGFLAKLRHCVHIDVLLSVYYALIYSYLRYGITSWGSASSSALQPLSALNNRAVRIMTSAPFGNIDVDSIYKYLNIPKISQIIELETGKFVFKKQNSLLPSNDIANHFELRNSQTSHHYNLRDRQIHLQTTKSSSAHGNKSIQFRASKLWNEIPDTLRSSESYSIFKSQFKKFLIEDDHSENGNDSFLFY